MTPSELTTWLEALSKSVRGTQLGYTQNKVPGCPIPFFGDVLKARVLTIGVNPSHTEFDKSRKWKTPLTTAVWQRRLLGYFNWPNIPAHEWFETWSICLELLGLNYSGGQAAHIDVSARPTKPMLGSATDKAEFRNMVEHDVKWFFELLSKLPQVQLLLVAGPVPMANGKKQQLANFIHEQSGKHGAKWVAGEPLPKLVTPDHPNGIPIFVCPFEPTVDGRYAMVRQVYRNRDLLRRLAAPEKSPISLIPARLDWASAIGNFITNFGILDMHVQDFLETLLSQAKFAKLKERPFHDRVERIKQRLGESDCTVLNKAKFAQFFHRLDTLRKTRNQIAHSVLRIGLVPGQKSRIQTLTLPKDLAGSEAGRRHLEFAELVSELKTLTDLIEEFQRLAGFKTSGGSFTGEV